MTKPLHRQVTYYDQDTGEILYTVGAAEGEEMPAGTFHGWVEGFVDGSRFYIDIATGEPAALLQFAPAISLNRIGDIPPGTTVHQGVESFTVDDGEIVFEPDLGLPQTVRLMLAGPCYADMTVEVPCGAS